MMCVSTRFPEAVPLRRITAQNVNKALVKIFTTVGLPKVVQSDQGSNFTSKIFQQVMRELGIKCVTSSAYHPQSQGALERFHQTLKNMMRTYCLEVEKDWDEGLPLLLFSVRESVQESLGFSPFELVFGHEVRGPLKVLREKLLGEDDLPGLLNYVTTFRGRPTRAREFAAGHLRNSQTVV
ncbi:KRAB-A domain-containing protein 2-like [Diadema antillarum]|uniref:KRAB-A domain-containing protein 2-like n=1 Tax=Diadema antillarum TaxID=105358 RepID=UPI003A8A800B